MAPAPGRCTIARCVRLGLRFWCCHFVWPTPPITPMLAARVVPTIPLTISPPPPKKKQQEANYSYDELLQRMQALLQDGDPSKAVSFGRVPIKMPPITLVSGCDGVLA